MNYNIMLIGFMGVGKTTVSKELSKKLGMPEVDMDSYIFEQYGEEYFRKVETNCLAEVQKSKGKIVSCGGGAVLKDENVKLMKDGGIILLLTATPETVYNRVKDNNDRPILNGNMNVEYISSLMDKRKNRYLEVADLIISTDDKSVVEIVKEIENHLHKMTKNSWKKINNGIK